MSVRTRRRRRQGGLARPGTDPPRGRRRGPRPHPCRGAGRGARPGCRDRDQNRPPSSSPSWCSAGSPFVAAGSGSSLLPRMPPCSPLGSSPPRRGPAAGSSTTSSSFCPGMRWPPGTSSPTGSWISGCSSRLCCWLCGGAAGVAGRTRVCRLTRGWDRVAPRVSCSAAPPVDCFSRAGSAGPRGRAANTVMPACRRCPPRRVGRRAERLGPAMRCPCRGVGGPDPRLRPGSGSSSADGGRPPGRRSGGRRTVEAARPGGPARPPHYLTMAGKPAGAHLVAISDLQRGADSRARQRLQLQLATSALATVDAVVPTGPWTPSASGRSWTETRPDPTAGTATPASSTHPAGSPGDRASSTCAAASRSPPTSPLCWSRDDRRHPARAQRGGRAPRGAERVPPWDFDPSSSTTGPATTQPRSPVRTGVCRGRGTAGFGSACFAGLTAATAQIVAFMDADASFDAADLPRVTGPVAAGEADLVLGARVARAGAWPWHARGANRALAGLVRRRTGLRLRSRSHARRPKGRPPLPHPARPPVWLAVGDGPAGARRAVADRRGRRRLPPRVGRSR